MSYAISYGKNKIPTTGEIVDSVVREVERERRSQLFSVTNDKEFRRHIDHIRKDQQFNQGWSKDKSRRWIGRIPADVYNNACNTFGEKALKADKKLFKKVFAPWIFVKTDSI